MSEDQTTHGKRFRLACVVFLYVCAGTAILLPLLMCGGFMLMGKFSTEPQRRVVTDPGADFTQYTGLTWPASAALISSGDIRLEFLGDGEFHLVFEVDRATLEQWLVKAPPWEQGEWQRGPVPEDIRWHCGFGASGMSADLAGGGPDGNINKVQVEQILGSKQIWYAAHDRASEWEHGEILILDPEHNRVWLSIWDF